MDASNKGNEVPDSPSANVNPIFPRMFASGTFVNSFAPNTSNEQDKECVIQAIEAFQANVIIVVENKPLEMYLDQWLKSNA